MLLFWLLSDLTSSTVPRIETLIFKVIPRHSIELFLCTRTPPYAIDIHGPNHSSRALPFPCAFLNGPLSVSIPSVVSPRGLILSRLFEWRLRIRWRQLPMPSQILIIPVDLSPIGLAVSLRISFCSLNARPRVDKQQAGHSEGRQRGHNCLRLD
jgi:hypothetical protein